MHYRALFVGLTTIDIQYFVHQFPKQNTKVKTNAPDILVGGPAANAAVAFSYLNKEAHLATVVGENSFTPFIKNDLCQTNVNLSDVANGLELNPIVASVVTLGNGDRNIFTHNPTEIQHNIFEHKLFNKVNPEILMLDGFYPEFSIEFAKLAKAKNIPVVIDCGSWKPQYKELLKFTDVAICSTDFYPDGCTTSYEVIDYLESHGIDKIAVSRGEKSILFNQEKSKGEIVVKQTQVVDTLGAGDFLHGAFCYYYLQTKNFKLALQQASKLASFSCGFKGTRQWLNN